MDQRVQLVSQASQAETVNQVCQVLEVLRVQKVPPPRSLPISQREAMLARPVSEASEASQVYRVSQAHEVHPAVQASAALMASQVSEVRRVSLCGVSVAHEVSQVLTPITATSAQLWSTFQRSDSPPRRVRRVNQVKLVSEVYQV